MGDWHPLDELFTGVKVNGIVPKMFNGVQDKSRDGRLAWDFEVTLRNEWGKRLPVAVTIYSDKKPELVDGTTVRVHRAARQVRAALNIRPPHFQHRNRPDSTYRRGARRPECLIASNRARTRSRSAGVMIAGQAAGPIEPDGSETWTSYLGRTYTKKPRGFPLPEPLPAAEDPPEEVADRLPVALFDPNPPIHDAPLPAPPPLTDEDYETMSQALDALGAMDLTYRQWVDRHYDEARRTGLVA